MSALAVARAALAELLTKREAQDKIKTDIVAAVEARGEKTLTADESTKVDEARAAIKTIDGDISAAEARVADLEDEEARDKRAAEARAKVGNVGPASVNEPATYRSGGPNSYFKDLARAEKDPTARDRLIRNDRETLESRALTTTDGAIGDFVIPIWMMDKFIQLARAGRVVADQVNKMDLPKATDTINLPRLTSGTATAVQSTQNSAVQNTDAASDTVSAAVQTIAGQQTISLQLLEQSPLNMDEVLLQDLARDYNTRLDTLVLNGAVTNAKGLLQVASTNSATYTSGSPTAAGLYPKVADAIQQIHTGRFEAPDKIFMHPRRWAFLLASFDSQNRPLVVPDPQGPFNALGTQAGVHAQGYVGTLQGLPVFVDPSIPTNLGAGTNEDRIIVVNSADIMLFEGTPRAEAFRETKADTLSVLLRLYNYYALHAARYPKAISVIGGTGLAAPTF